MIPATPFPAPLPRAWWVGLRRKRREGFVLVREALRGGECGGERFFYARFAEDSVTSGAAEAKALLAKFHGTLTPARTVRATKLRIGMA